MSRRWPWLVVGAAALAIGAWAVWPTGAGPRAGAADGAAPTTAGAPGAARAGAGPARVVDGRPLAGATRREPAPVTEGATELTGRIPATLDARVQAALASCAREVGVGAGARVFVYLTVVVAQRLTIEALTTRGAEAPLTACLTTALTAATLDAPADAPPGRFQVTISGLVAGPPAAP